MLLLPFVVGTVRGVQDAGFRPVTLALGALWLVGYLAYSAAGLWLKSRPGPATRARCSRTARLRPCSGRSCSCSTRRSGLGARFVPFLALGLWASARRTERWSSRAAP